MRFEFFGFEVVPKTALARWLVAGAVVLTLMMFFAHSSQRGKQVNEQVKRVVGFDMPAGMKPEWTQRREDHTITLDPRGSIEMGKPLARGYRLEEKQARQLMETCAERGGQVVSRSEVARRYPSMNRRMHYDTPICMRTDDRPTHSVALLQGDRLVVQIASF